MSTARIAATLLASAGLFLGTGAAAVALSVDDAPLAVSLVAAAGDADPRGETGDDGRGDGPRDANPTAAATVLALEVAPYRLTRRVRLAA